MQKDLNTQGCLTLPNRFYDENEVAELLRVSVQTLRNNRHRGVGLPYIKIGRRVVYDPSDIQAAVNEGRVVPAAI